MNKTKNVSEQQFYLYIVFNKAEEKKRFIFLLSLFLILLNDGNNCRTDFHTQLMSKRNEYMIFFREGGARSSSRVMPGHRWSYSFETRDKVYMRG